MRGGNAFKLSFIFLVIVLILFVSENHSLSARAEGELRIKVIGLKSNEGLVRFGLFNSKKSYYKKSNAFMGTDLKVKNQTCEWVVKNIPYGEYAIMLYHDENGNKKLDRNLLGFPREQYGFSNNVRAKFRMPRYKKTKFLLEGKTQILEIKVQ